MPKFLSDRELEIEDFKAIIWILLVMLVLVSGFLINVELVKPIHCTADFCMDDFCIILKGVK